MKILSVVFEQNLAKPRTVYPSNILCYTVSYLHITMNVPVKAVWYIPAKEGSMKPDISSISDAKAGQFPAAFHNAVSQFGGGGGGGGGGG